MELLRNAVRPYAWGSRTAIADLLGRPVPAPHPEAELWMGAHPGDPSRLLRADGSEVSLLHLLRSEPARQLGAACTDRWGTRLPFLLKVLAVDEPLSLQAHPSADQAAAGFAEEEASGIARNASHRNYPDPTAKPELICALTEFHALAGFRDAHRTVRLLHELDVPSLRAHTGLLAAQPDQDGLRALFTTWITLPEHYLRDVMPELLEACAAHLRAHGEFAMECRTVLELGADYPNDAGVLASLLLNRIVLQPGEAIFLPAGNLHAYLHGTGVEILANSDNILRCGLTPKHVDVAELLRVLDFECGDMRVLSGRRQDQNLTVYRTPAEEFELSRVDWSPQAPGGVRLDSIGPQILLCTRGRIRLSAHGELELGRGESVWLAASDPAVIARPVDIAADGAAQVFRAAPGAV
ncbi:mannose-6-phosphate isomerase, class I [Haloactinomyces albus]|uniref:mannose-6-phosphate isomerase n=1 Tax=Haloactinomyces albus TaxID=1352928 RepID=A0AAE3ZCH5_9ACTN|nr:mannose-6-phosphate isomerase, class I [Haloactinomyces albus]MDR7301295.1 mannose-6-phosphate isomerase [Haloactinomyces albus]